MKSVRLNIEGLQYKETQDRVRNQLESLNGVQDVCLSIDDKYVDVNYDWPATDSEINNHLQNNGYKIK